MDAASGNQPETSGVSPVADAYPQGALHLYSTEAVPGGTYGLIQLSNGAIPKSAGFTNPNGEWVASTTAGTVPPTLTPPARVSALLNNFTAMAWIKPSTTTGIHRVFSSQTGGANACWGFGLNGLRMRFTDYGQYDTDSPNAPIVANVWQHLAVVKSSTAGVQFYVNGTLSYSDATRTANLIQTPDALTQWRLLNGPGGENFLGNVAEVRLYDHLFTTPTPGADGDLLDDLNPDSEKVLANAFVEASLANAEVGTTFQFERLGYFAPDTDTAPGKPVFNRTLTLKDTWAKVQAQSAG
jgi:hypothetical protein